MFFFYEYKYFYDLRQNREKMGTDHEDSGEVREAAVRLAGWSVRVCVCLDGDSHTFCSVTAADGCRVHCLICDIHLQPKKGGVGAKRSGMWGGGANIKAESQQAVGGWRAKQWAADT